MSANVTLAHGDSMEHLDLLEADEFHAVVCDPPYGLNFKDEEWDSFEKTGTLGANRAYQEWCTEWAAKVRRVLRPGGHLVAFSGNRTHHRLFAGIEDAGFEIRDTVTWHYSTGFPKGARLATWLSEETDLEKWGAWRSTLKPASEFAVLARKPLSESSATANQVRWGTGNLNVEAGRLAPADPDDAGNWTGTDATSGGVVFDESTGLHGPGSNATLGDGTEGRFPPNLAFDATAAALFDESFPDEFGGPSRFFYTSRASTAERTHGGTVENEHPTVKPLDLMEWLVSLVTAEGQRVLDPFCGSGTTLLACLNTGREGVGIEREAEYVEIARNRLNAVEAEFTVSEGVVA